MIKLDIHKVLRAADGEMNLAVNIEISKGQLVTIYGDSGAGKTSILRILSGVLVPEAGEIIVDGEPWFDSSRNINIPPQKRMIGYVFQDYALFPNMTVRENLAFALGSGHDNKIINRLIEIIELKELQDRYPGTLSGGQQQRVALARALVQKPKLLLLDEPLAALDIKIRMKLQDYILKAHQEYGLTTILISHDIGEIIKLSDYVFILEKGSIKRKGSPAEVFINKQISGKFKFTGEVLRLERQDVICIVTVLIENTVVKVIAQPEEVDTLKVGDKVMVASKAFNPIIYKVNGG
ncbi:MAG TPA: ATP-binding cassette domain-containing protein [Bacteroidales bacterium]|nr:ATP-binding cassette domain-containing protein [Bacteroidales bacterium]